LVEIQGTAEGTPFSRQELTALVDLAETGIQQLTEMQRNVLGG
jgi:ribonuclease PH